MNNSGLNSFPSYSMKKLFTISVEHLTFYDVDNLLRKRNEIMMLSKKENAQLRRNYEIILLIKYQRNVQDMKFFTLEIEKLSFFFEFISSPELVKFFTKLSDIRDTQKYIYKICTNLTVL